MLLFEKPISSKDGFYEFQVTKVFKLDTPVTVCYTKKVPERFVRFIPQKGKFLLEVEQEIFRDRNECEAEILIYPKFN